MSRDPWDRPRVDNRPDGGSCKGNRHLAPSTPSPLRWARPATSMSMSPPSSHQSCCCACRRHLLRQQPPTGAHAVAAASTTAGPISSGPADSFPLRSRRKRLQTPV